jgi:hypothetical protein
MHRNKSFLFDHLVCARSVGGTASTLALVRLTISSNLVGCAGRVRLSRKPEGPYLRVCYSSLRSNFLCWFQICKPCRSIT